MKVKVVQQTLFNETISQRNKRIIEEALEQRDGRLSCMVGNAVGIAYLQGMKGEVRVIVEYTGDNVEIYGHEETLRIE